MAKSLENRKPKKLVVARLLARRAFTAMYRMSRATRSTADVVSIGTGGNYVLVEKSIRQGPAETGEKTEKRY